LRRITLWIVTTIAGIVLLFSYRTSLGAAVPSTAVSAAAPGIVPGAPSPSGTSKPRPSRAVTANGTVAQTRWGPVQVQVKIANGRIIDVTTLQQPTGSDRDDEINGYALPQLRAEVLAAQSGRIDAVSGATVTSGGYQESLQAALDAAHFG
jgi:uncharacterized protein with FMN-binding domain